MKRRVIAWGPAVSWAAVLFFLSELRGLPSGLERFGELDDKVVHTLLYSTLGITLAWGRQVGLRKPPHLLLLVIGYAYGALDEWHQSFVPGRTPELGDFFADVLGVTVGYLLFTGIRRATAGAGRVGSSVAATRAGDVEGPGRGPDLEGPEREGRQRNAAHADPDRRAVNSERDVPGRKHTAAHPASRDGARPEEAARAEPQRSLTRQGR